MLYPVELWAHAVEKTLKVQLFRAGVSGIRE